MNAVSLENLISIIGGLLVVGGFGGAAWIGVNELRLRAIRRGRMATAGGGPGMRMGPTPKTTDAGLGNQVMGAFKRLGQQSAVRDPGKLSVLRARLMQAGFYNREAPVIYLGVRAAALVAATVRVMITLPFLMGGKGRFGGIAVAGVLAGAAILGPDKVLSM